MSQEGVTRELPEEQNQLDEDADDNFMQTMERANELSQQYEEIKDRTLGDGLVAGRLEDIDTSPANSNILVLVDLPGEGANKKFRFKKPKVWSREYDFVRWIQHYGYDADSFPSMIKAKCDVKVENIGDEEYKLYIPEDNKRRENIKERFSGVSEYVEAAIKAYRHEDNKFYFVYPLLLFNTIHALLWVTPFVSYGFEPLPALVFVVISYILIVALGVVEDEMIKTRSSRY